MSSTLYLLDTNIIIYAQRGHANVLKRMQEVGRDDIVLSSLVVAELAFGVEKSLHKEQNRTALRNLLSSFQIQDWNESAAWIYAAHYHRLRAAGTPIGIHDLQIGCHALALDAVCVTNNTREFERIEGLKLENWVQPGIAA
jgi:tRNA(fMet)-specific endonuclease VapC